MSDTDNTTDSPEVNSSELLAVWDADKKLQVLDFLYYQGQKEPPAEGKYYCLPRKGLELWKVGSMNDKETVMISICNELGESIEDLDCATHMWETEEFTNGGFAENRIYIPDWMLKSWIG